MFSVTCGVCQGCVLAPTLFNFYFDTAIHMALNIHRQEERGIKVAYVRATETTHSDSACDKAWNK